MKKIIKSYLILCLIGNLATLVCPPYRRWIERVYIPWMLRALRLT